MVYLSNTITLPSYHHYKLVSSKESKESVFTCMWCWWCHTSQWRSAALDITVYRCFLSIAEAGDKRCPGEHLPPTVSMSPSSLPPLDRKTTHSLSITVSTDLSLWLEMISMNINTRKHMHACTSLAESDVSQHAAAPKLIATSQLYSNAWVKWIKCEKY